MIQLNRREKLSIYAGVFVLLLFAVLKWGFFPFMEYKSRLESGLTSASAALSEMVRLSNEFEDKNRLGKGDAAVTLNRDFSLYSFLEKKAGEAGVKQHISYMTPSETPLENESYKLSQIEMMLEEIDMDGLTRFLYAVEMHNAGIVIRRLSLSKAGNDAMGIDAVFQVETIIETK